VIISTNTNTNVASMTETGARGTVRHSGDAPIGSRRSAGNRARRDRPGLDLRRKALCRTVTVEVLDSRTVERTNKAGPGQWGKGPAGHNAAR
jgi:hypothetical protein